MPERGPAIAEREQGQKRHQAEPGQPAPVQVRQCAHQQQAGQNGQTERLRKRLRRVTPAISFQTAGMRLILPQRFLHGFSHRFLMPLFCRRAENLDLAIKIVAVPRTAFRRAVVEIKAHGGDADSAFFARQNAAMRVCDDYFRGASVRSRRSRRHKRNKLRGGGDKGHRHGIILARPAVRVTGECQDFCQVIAPLISFGVQRKCYRVAFAVAANGLAVIDRSITA